jgi:hypothetical protein
MDYDFAAELDDQITYLAYNPEKWATRKEWFEDMYEQGYYWISDDYDDNGELRKR